MCLEVGMHDLLKGVCCFQLGVIHGDNFKAIALTFSYGLVVDKINMEL